MGVEILSHNQEAIVYSEVFEIEFTEGSVKLRPFIPSSFRKWLNYNPVAVAMKAFNEQNIPMIEIGYNSIIGYKADPGFPMLGSPRIKLVYWQNGLSEYQLITFQSYTLLPSYSYNRLRSLLKLHSIADQSNKINVYARHLTWLIVPAYFLLGFYIAKNFSSPISIFGAVFSLYGVLLILVSIGEIMWRIARLIGER